MESYIPHTPLSGDRRFEINTEFTSLSDKSNLGARLHVIGFVKVLERGRPQSTDEVESANSFVRTRRYTTPAKSPFLRRSLGGYTKSNNMYAVLLGFVGSNFDKKVRTKHVLVAPCTVLVHVPRVLVTGSGSCQIQFCLVGR